MLKEYLIEHEKEAVSIMMAINDVQYNMNAYLNEYGDKKMAEGIGKGTEQTFLENIRNVMEGLDMPLEEALELLKVPKADYEKYKNLI